MPWTTSSQAFLSISDDKITVLVVPSLAILSCREEAPITILATGCSTLAVSSTVTPSFVTKVLPSSSISNLSRPLGPRVDLIAPASAMAACTFFFRASRPVERVVSLRISPSPIVSPPASQT